MRERRTVVFGGAFNPPTRAHEAIIETLFERLDVAHLIVVPVGSHYQKEALASFDHRLAMLEALYASDPSIEIVSIEQHHETFRGTVDTLDALQEKYPDPLYYVIGADHLKELKHWIESERLLSLYRFIVFNRARQDLAAVIENDSFLKQYQAQFICVEDIDFPEASTLYRQTLNTDVLSEKIAAYVHHHRLYEKE